MSKRDKNTMERKGLWYQSQIVLLVTSAYTFHTVEGVSWHFLGLVYYDMVSHVIICNDFTKLFEFLMEENEVGQLSQYSDSLQGEWHMLDSQKELFSSAPHSDLCRYSGYSRWAWFSIHLSLIKYKTSMMNEKLLTCWVPSILTDRVLYLAVINKLFSIKYIFNIVKMGG